MPVERPPRSRRRLLTSRVRLDMRALWTRLDEERELLGLTWREVARESGVSHPTFARMARDEGRGIHSTALVAVLVWMDAVGELGDFLTPNVDDEGEEP